MRIRRWGDVDRQRYGTESLPTDKTAYPLPTPRSLHKHRGFFSSWRGCSSAAVADDDDDGGAAVFYSWFAVSPPPRSNYRSRLTDNDGRPPPASRFSQACTPTPSSPRGRQFRANLEMTGLQPVVECTSNLISDWPRIFGHHVRHL